MKKGVKEWVVEEYLRGGISQRRLADKYGVGHSTIDRWIQQHRGNVPVKMVPREILILPEMAQEVRKDLPEEVQELRRQLEQERLRNKLLTAMINIAETELKISIRKKPGTKPSTK